ncbi:hypothetical protein BMS3Abin04_02800 [bacterium BMS3Abin04]|nr:hypothetical protein BMS3Abin04_02800 [bacterium BMS3Abin04]
MKYLAQIFILPIVLFSLFSCSDSLVPDTLPGTYNVTAFDSLGLKISQGSLTVNLISNSKIEGEWSFIQIGSNSDDGFMFGDGKYTGIVNGDTVRINLNPDMIDNNINLFGIFNDGVIAGKWEWSTFIGVTARGTFNAVKE